MPIDPQEMAFAMKKADIKNTIHVAIRGVEWCHRLDVLIDVLAERLAAPDHIESPDYFWDLGETV